MATQPQTQSRPLEMTGWLVHWDGGESLASFEANAQLIARVCPQWYFCETDGLPAHAPRTSKALREKVAAVARQNGCKLFALTANAGEKGFDAARVSKFLNDPLLMERHAKALAQMAQEDGADGIDLDYEDLYAKDRDVFSLFVEKMAVECRQRGLLLAVAVHPKQSEPGLMECEIAQDWKRIGAVVDFFRPMCYDENNSLAPHGPVASPDWIRMTMELAVQLVLASKIELGIPVYGYDRNGGKNISYTWPEFEKAAQKHGPAHRDPVTQELTFQYDGREVWFVDTEALKVQYGIAKKLGLRGLAVWRLGGEDPQFWNAFQKNR